MQLSPRQENIIKIVAAEPNVSISQIKEQLPQNISIPTLNRDIATLVTENYLTKTGKGRATSYSISLYYKILAPIEIEPYFSKEPDNRQAANSYNYDLLSTLNNIDVLDLQERKHLLSLKDEYHNNIRNFPPALYQKELERLTIELSWKSSQIEGNTYSLLETEKLFLENEEAADKPHADAIMLLNHKDAFHFLLEHKDIGKKLDITFLEHMHMLLIKDLGVSKNIRSRTVGITGTTYKPLDNKYQIKEALERMCELINGKENFFEKALLAVVLISYIQPFEDGNKRTGRMVSNALLIANKACPLSYRNVDSLDYKKAMLLFYEQNNITAFKQLFISQNEFSVNNYFS